MNNKGFAITTILYGILLLFCLLLVSLLGLLSAYRKSQEMLIEANNGARDNVRIDVDEDTGVPYADNDNNDDDDVSTNGTGVDMVR